MKFLLQILFLFLICFTNSVNATTVFSKVTIPSYEFSFSKIENKKLESEAKIGIKNFARSGVSENSISKKANLQDSYVLKETYARTSVKLVNGAGNLWKSFLDDAFTIQKRAKAIANGLPPQFPNLTIDELTAIKVYTSNELRNGSYIYQTLNTELRAGNLSAYNAGLNDLVNNALSKLPAHNGNVFRWVYGAEANLAKTWQVSDDIPFKDFKSSSTSKEIAVNRFADENGGDVFYEIIGAKAANVCGVSCLQTEMEVLLKSNQKFKVKQIQPNHMVFDEDLQIQKPFTRIVLEINNMEEYVKKYFDLITHNLQKHLENNDFPAEEKEKVNIRLELINELWHRITWQFKGEEQKQVCRLHWLATMRRSHMPNLSIIKQEKAIHIYEQIKLTLPYLEALKQATIINFVNDLYNKIDLAGDFYKKNFPLNSETEQVFKPYFEITKPAKGNGNMFEECYEKIEFLYTELKRLNNETPS